MKTNTQEYRYAINEDCLYLRSQDTSEWDLCNDETGGTCSDLVDDSDFNEDNFTIFTESVDIMEDDVSVYDHHAAVLVWKSQYAKLRTVLSELKALDANGWCNATDGTLDDDTLTEQVELVRQSITEIKAEDEPVEPITDTEALTRDSAYKSEWVAKSGAWKVEEWTRKEGTERSVVVIDGQCLIAEMNCDDAPAPVEVPNPYTWSYEEAKQHAKLIAAAPALLQVAQEALAAIESAHEALHEDFKASGLYKDADEINSLDAMMELAGQIVPLTAAISKAKGGE
tara:strand:+ start:1840 stop:2691 length:852 start_codon:yes stop_codon:yes gene_type:complete